MITGLIHVERGVEALAVTLSALVPAVAEGLLGDAVVTAHDPEAGVAAVAEAMGAELVALKAGDDPWALASRRARGQWCLCLADGDVPGEGWVRGLEAFLRIAGITSVGRLTRRPTPIAASLRNRMEGATGRVSVRAGDIIHKDRFVHRPAKSSLVILPVTVFRQPGLDAVGR
jgi:hypothetical protein